MDQYIHEITYWYNGYINQLRSDQTIRAWHNLITFHVTFLRFFRRIQENLQENLTAYDLDKTAHHQWDRKTSVDGWMYMKGNRLKN